MVEAQFIQYEERQRQVPDLLAADRQQEKQYRGSEPRGARASFLLTTGYVAAQPEQHEQRRQ
jgi:hypothetical protein